MDVADYTLLRQCVPNARFASANLGNSARTANSNVGAITLRNRNYARMRRHMALVLGRSNSRKSHVAQEQSSQIIGSARIGPINIGPSGNVHNNNEDDDETEMALLGQILQHYSVIAVNDE